MNKNDNLYEDYHLHCSDYNLFFKYASEKLYKFEGGVISICNHDYMLDPFMIDSIAKRYGFELIPGFGFETSDKVEINVYNPKESGLSLIKKLEQEKEIWTLLFIKELQNMGIFANLKKMLKKKELKQLELYDICKEVVKKQKYFENETNCMNNLIIPMIVTNTVPRNKISFEEAIEILKQEDYYVCYTKNSKEIIKNNLKQINGIIVKNQGEITELLPSNVKVRFGSNSWIKYTY